LPGWQALYKELNKESKAGNFEIISVAEDTGGAKDAGPWITAAKPEFIALVDEQQIVTQKYNMVNVPTAVWIDERGRIVRPNEVAFVDDRFKSFTGMDSAPYVDAIRDWATNGAKSIYALSEAELKARLTPPSGDRAMADAEFALAEYLYKQSKIADAIPHFKEAQRLAPDNWNYKRQAWALSNAERDYGTSFKKEVDKLNGKPYYEPRKLPEAKKGPND
jgi:tetratricopeptide (TPR) repeat protein